MASPEGKENPTWAFSSPSIVGSFPRGSCRSFPWGSLGKSVGLDPWGLDKDGEGGGGLWKPGFRSWWTVFWLAAAPKQRSQSAVLSICTAEGGPVWPGSSVLSNLGPSQEAVMAMEPLTTQFGKGWKFAVLPSC